MFCKKNLTVLLARPLITEVHAYLTFYSSKIGVFADTSE
jgi:hypothetical protein